MKRINILPKNIAELIAAGEVVERPASVVKELVENSIDAGATTVTVEIKNGGVTYIRVTDNGHGIFYEDVPKAFISHATSKVLTADDLNSIFTLGFRGEALASIAAVSRTEILTKSAEEEHGTSFAVEGGQQARYEYAGCPNGTTVVVRDLFYNTPARMKFLKKDVAEANAVADVVDKLALSHPEISFRFIRDGKQAILTPGDSKLISAVYSVFGKDFADTLIETDYELDGIRVKGLVCKPIASRQSRAMQFFFLNGRYIKSRACTASLENAYKNSVMTGKFPACVLNITVAPYSVDVNVHPTKTEVRFSDERKVYSAVYYAAKTAIENMEEKPKLDISKVIEKAAVTGTQLHLAQSSPAKKGEPLRAQAKDSFWQKTDFKAYTASQTVASSQREDIFSQQSREEPDLIGNVYYKREPLPSATSDESQKSEGEKDSFGTAPVPETEITEEKQETLRVIGEVFKTYIICEYGTKLYLIDKHAAHERILFNKLKERYGENKSQILLSAITVTLGKNEYNAVMENMNVFAKAGFVIDDFGKGSVIIREFPMLIDSAQAEEIVADMAANLALGKTDSSSDKIDMLLHTTACKAAIKAGNNTTAQELEALAARVITDNSVRYCPHGRPVLIELSKYELEKQFKRIQ